MDTDSAEYVLGGSDAERARLRAQAADHEASARWLLREVGVAPGWRVLDVGCGPLGILALLSELVGRDGEVIGLEREDRFVEMARAEVAQRGLANVSIVQGDALSTGLDRGSFDLVHERLVLVNVPERRELVREMVSLAAPGGVIVLEDIDNVSWVCEPHHESWTILLEVFHQTFRAGGGDPFAGRRLAGLLREAGIPDVQMSVHAALPQPGQYRRTHLLSLIESVRGKAIGSGVISETELDRHCAELRGHLTDPATVVIDKLLIQSWGRKPA
jgi:ubiquinone/menaquinone biosynthesis C-methylase UbiE